MKRIKLLLVSIISFCFVQMTNAQTVTLNVFGEGKSQEQAKVNALRNAIEQAFGTFVSSNTSILNDNVVKDEIVSISRGNIQKYQEVSCNVINGVYNVQLQATVSIGQLVSYAKSKGSSAELSGATFAMNVKIKELNKRNEEIAIKHLKKQLMAFERSSNFFDYKVELDEPFEWGGEYRVKVKVICTPNKNYEAYNKMLQDGLNALSSKTRTDEFSVLSIPTDDYRPGIGPIHGVYYFRSNEFHDLPFWWWLTPANSMKFRIVDNIGKETTVFAIRKASEAVYNDYSRYHHKLGAFKSGYYGYLDFYSDGAEHFIGNTGGHFYEYNSHNILWRVENENGKMEFSFSYDYTVNEISKLQKIDVFPVGSINVYDEMSKGQRNKVGSL